MAFNGYITDRTKVDIAVKILRNITDTSNEQLNFDNFGDEENVEQRDREFHFAPELYVSGQAFGDEAVEMLCTALEATTTLKRLYLDYEATRIQHSAVFKSRGKL